MNVNVFYVGKDQVENKDVIRIENNGNVALKTHRLSYTYPKGCVQLCS